MQLDRSLLIRRETVIIGLAMLWLVLAPTSASVTLAGTTCYPWGLCDTCGMIITAIFAVLVAVTAPAMNLYDARHRARARAGRGTFHLVTGVSQFPSGSLFAASR